MQNYYYFSFLLFHALRKFYGLTDRYNMNLLVFISIYTISRYNNL